jgi:hypothetical protein
MHLNTILTVAYSVTRLYPMPEDVLLLHRLAEVRMCMQSSRLL